MSDLENQFKQAADEVQQLKDRPGDATLLKLYALYKQATIGDVSGSRPGLSNFVGRTKYDSWAKVKGMSTTEAMQQYIALVEKLKKGKG